MTGASCSNCPTRWRRTRRSAPASPFGASLRDSTPEFLVELGAESGLPPLPEYQINLHAPKPGLNPIADELVRHIRQEFTVRFGGLGAGLPTKATRPPRIAREPA